MTLQLTVEKLLKSADISIGGSRPWDISVNHGNFYIRLLRDGELGIGESYVEGEWDCDRIDILADKLLRANVTVPTRTSLSLLSQAIRYKTPWVSSRLRSHQVGLLHYDIGNDLYQCMLDKRMVYTCAYWQNIRRIPEKLDKAQEQKLDLVCRKLHLQANMTILDIGGGWGSFAKFAAENYAARVVNITVSKQQIALANELTKGLPVENRLQDYRDVTGQFDRIVSLGMFEHVTAPHYAAFFRVARRCLKPDGLFLLHTIGNLSSRTIPNRWTTKYIFPNSMLPSAAHISNASEGVFVMEDWHNFGADYDPTLMAWWHNFHCHWPRFKDIYGERFYRMWKLYLQGAAGGFRARKLQLWQIVFSHSGVAGGYSSVR